MIKYSKLTVTILVAFILFTSSFGQNELNRVQSYINQYKELAIAEMLRTGVPAAITLAQGILETAGGQSDLASLANNHFGIKCKSDWTGDYMLHDDDAKNECFRKYASVEESYKDHSDFLKNKPNYAFLFKLDPTDYEGWAKGLKKAGYATSPTYAQNLIKTIVENNLQDFTLLALERHETGDDLFANVKNDKPILNTTPTVLQDKPITPEPKKSIETPVLKNNTIAVNTNNTISTSNTSNIPAKQVVETPKKKPVSYPLNTVFNINDCKVIFAEGGTSLLALAANYNVAYARLLEFNELNQIEILNESQLVYLQKKPKKGAKEIHVVEENESLHEIAQKEGLQLSSLLELNGLRKNMQPAIGEKIYLKYPAPSTPKLANATSLMSNSSM